MPADQAADDQIRDALLGTAAIGPFFAIELGVAGPGWQPAAQWYRAGLPRLIDRAGGRLGSSEPRVTASIMQLDFAAKLWSPVLACGLSRGIVPDLTGLLVTSGLPVRLGVASPAGWLAAEPGLLAALSYRVVMDGHLAALAASLPIPVADGLLQGNAASAMAGALTTLVRARPSLAGPARETAAALLGTGFLRDTGELTGRGLAFRRRSCCLYYRLPGGRLCGDCCFDRRPGG